MFQRQSQMNFPEIEPDEPDLVVLSDSDDDRSLEEDDVAIIPDMELAPTHNPYFGQDMNKICALCVNKLDNLRYDLNIDIKISPKEAVKAHQVLESLSKFKYCGVYPRFLCSTCFDNTVAAYKFQQMCNQAQVMFEHFIIHQEQQEEQNEIEISESESEMPSTNDKQDENVDNLPKNKGIKYRLVRCKICNRQVRYTSLKRHMSNVHSPSIIPDGSKVTIVTCPVCDKKLLSDYLKRHLKRMHKNSIPCNECDTVFRNKFDYDNHMKNRHEPLYTCEHCPKSYKHKTSLAWHRKLHTGELPYVCQFCDKTFTKTYRWKQHQKTHVENTMQQATGGLGPFFSQIIVHNAPEQSFDGQICEL